MTKRAIIFALFFGLCCLNALAQTADIDLQNVTALCNRLPEIKRLPQDWGEKGVDPVYDTLIEAGNRIIPCLIDKVADTTIMPDPRCPPITNEMRVGDMAYFLLVDITEIGFVDLLPADIQEKYKTEGMYAYHEYVEQTGNREKFQSELREWYRKQSVVN